MSTKKLSRTVTEGKKSNRIKTGKKFLNKSFRAAERAYLDDIRKDLNFVDEEVTPVREQNYGWRSTRIAPAFRWLKSQVGRLWNDVHSDMCNLFEKNSDAYKCLLRRVEETPNYDYRQYKDGIENFKFSYYKNYFYVDENGILFEKEIIKRPKYEPYHLHLNKYPELIPWLNGRIVSKVGDKYYWNIIKYMGYTEWRASLDRWNSHIIYEYLTYDIMYDTKSIISNPYQVPKWKQPFYYKTKKLSSCQDKEFSNKDVRYFESLPLSIQKHLLKWAPNSTEEMLIYPW